MTSNKRAPRTLLLPARMEIGCLEELYTEMSKLTSRKRKALILDGGEVSVIDTSGIQLLVAFIRKLSDMGCAVSWENYSVQVYQMADELGVSSELDE